MHPNDPNFPGNYSTDEVTCTFFHEGEDEADDMLFEVKATVEINCAWRSTEIVEFSVINSEARQEGSKDEWVDVNDVLSKDELALLRDTIFSASEDMVKDEAMHAAEAEAEYAASNRW